MRVCVLLFGPHAAALGADRAEVDVATAASASALHQMLAHDFPALRPLLQGCRIAVNGEFALPERRILPDDEVALIGLVAGG